MIKKNYKSFRDPAARVIEEDGVYYRYIFNEYKQDYDMLMQSGLYQELVSKWLLITHEEITTKTLKTDVYKLLKPQQISFQSYPFEWSFSQWKKVILSFLTINQIALRYGMILKDATPYNFYLKDGNAIMFDTSSFVKYNEGDFWVGYRQFCEELLSPVALMYYMGQRWSKIYRTHLHGIPLAFVSKQLPISSWFNITCLVNIHMHAKFDNNTISNGINRTKGFSLVKLQALIRMIRTNIVSWKSSYTYQNHWSGYYENNIESEQYLKKKEEIIDNWLSTFKPLRVLDLGANTGRFSKIASFHTNEVIALEADEYCVDIIQQMIISENIQNIHTLVGELSEPSPSLGILNIELASIFDRANADMVFGLALIHHLCITKYMSMDLVAELFAKFSSKYIIVEYIPREDKKVKILLTGREDTFQSYTEDNFIRSFNNLFELVEKKETICSERVLYLWEKRNK